LALVDRIGEAGEIAAAVEYLDRAEFVTGHILPVDGGFISGRP
jgi:NAD(P)-dependent dehydrogenase (short-subunit alcohol dehydrogenase family)